MRVIIYACFIGFVSLVFSCTGEQKKHSQSHGEERQNAEKKAEHYFLSQDSAHLLYHVFQDLKLDSCCLGYNGIDTIIDDIQIEFQYRIEEGMLIEMQGNIRSDSVDVMPLINAHFARFENDFYPSENFNTWILPLNKRPLIEVVAVQEKNGVSINLNVRQHI